ncbi:MAG: phosphate signaling complex protein PhoU [Desulfitobacterium hafniense]|nr:phosphate signaling complex protein PhoU [Desulfitobacterium hafniense]
MGFTRQIFDKALEELQQEILRMGSLVEQAIHEAVQSMAQQDVALAEKVMAADNFIDQLELDIEDKCTKLIATQQPMARDLRKIGTGIRIITDLERMGDHAFDIAKTTLRLANDPLIKPLIDIPRMAGLAQKMVKDSLDSYVHLDVELARKMCADDDKVDEIYSYIFDELIGIMEKDPSTVYQATHLLFVARYIERIADHATNIGEAVIYLVTGVRKELNL